MEDRGGEGRERKRECWVQKRGRKDATQECDEWLTCAVQSRVRRVRGSCYMQYRQRCGKGHVVDTADEVAEMQHV